MYSYNPYYDRYLAHHGVKGMKWGIRRYQNPDGTLTEKGKKRIKTSKTIEKVAKAVTIALGTTAVAAGTYYAAKKLGPQIVNSTIKAGAKIDTISDTPSFNNGDRIYAAINKDDSILYEKFYGQEKAWRNSNAKAYQLHRVATDKIKVASDNNFKNAVVNLYKKNDAINNVGDTFKDGAMNNIQALADLKDADAKQLLLHIQNGSFNINKKSDQKQLAKVMNIALVNKDKLGREANDKIYNELSKKGFDAVKDVNDRILSGDGYRTKNPVVIFNLNKTKPVGLNVIGANYQDLQTGQRLLRSKLDAEKKIKELPIAAGTYTAKTGFVYGVARMQRKALEKADNTNKESNKDKK